MPRARRSRASSRQPRSKQRKEDIVDTHADASASDEDMPDDLEADPALEELNPAVFTIAFFKPKKASTLVRRLLIALDTFQRVGQGEHMDDIAAVAAELARDEFVSHANKDVRLVVACCLVEILRIFAPDAPFNDAVLMNVFDLLFAQLRGLSSTSGSTFKRVTHILESLATVRTCNALVAIAHDDSSEDMGDESDLRSEASERIVELFNVLLSRIREAHSSKVVTEIRTIITCCLEDMQFVSEAALDSILQWLLPSDDPEDGSPQDRARAKAVVVEILQHNADRLHPVISQFVTVALTGANFDTGVVCRSSSGVLHELISELNKVDSNLMLHILPVVAQQLQVADEDDRSAAVALLSRLFLDKSTNLPSSHTTNFVEFLGRFKDSSKDIRIKMVEFAKLALIHKPHLVRVADELVGRFKDPVVQVRQEAVDAACSAAQQEGFESLRRIPQSLLEGVAGRLLDKQAAIRKAAMTGLARIYAVHIRMCWSDDVSEQVATQVGERLNWIPGRVFMCFTFKEADLRLRVVQLLDTIMLHKSLDASTRATGLLHIYLNIDDKEKNALHHILQYRHGVQVAVRRFLRLHQEARKQKATAPLAKKAAGELSQFVTAGTSAAPVLRRLSDIVDQKVFACLAKLVDCRTPKEELFKTKNDLISRLSSRDNELASHMKPLVRHATMHTATSDMMAHFLNVVSEYEEGDEAEETGQLLVLLATQFPGLFDSVHKKLGELTGSVVESTKTAALSCLSQVAKRIAKRAKFVTALCRHLITAALEGTPRQAKFAVLAYLDMGRPAEPLLTALVSEDSLTTDNVNLVSVLKALSAFALLQAPLFLEHSVEVATFVRDEVLNAPYSVSKRRQRPTPSDDALGRVVALKFLTNVARGLAPLRREEANESATFVFGQLVSIIQSDGNPADAEVSMNAVDRAALRKAAFGCVLRLARIPSFESLMTPEQWHQTSRVMQDKSMDVRRYALAKVYKGLMRRQGHKLSVRYLSFFALLAHDSDIGLRKQARVYLQKAAALKQRLYSLRVAKHGDAGVSASQVHHFMPEYCLPFTIHLLAHDPSFDESRIQRPTQQLAFMISGLLSTSSTNDNMGFMMHLLHRIRGCEDRLDPDADHVHLLVEVAQRVLRKHVRRDSNLSNYQGEMFIPAKFYQAATRRHHVDVALLEGQAIHKSPAKKRSSPIKSRSPRAVKARRTSASSRRSSAGSRRSTTRRASDMFEDTIAADDERATRRSSRSTVRSARRGMYTEVDSDAEDNASVDSTVSASAALELAARAVEKEAQSADSDDEGLSDDAAVLECPPSPVRSRRPTRGTRSSKSATKPKPKTSTPPKRKTRAAAAAAGPRRRSSRRTRRA